MKKTFNEMITFLQNQKDWISIEETADFCGRMVENVIVGILSSD